MKPVWVSLSLLLRCFKAELAVVMSSIMKEFNINFASDYLKTVQMSEIEDIPRYRPSLTLPLVSSDASCDAFSDICK